MPELNVDFPIPVSLNAYIWVVQSKPAQKLDN